MSSPPGASFRAKVHTMLRTSILDAAWDRLVESDWSDVRISDIASDVGVSRQTIYNEFGAKDQLAEAVLLREVGRFVKAILREVERASDLRGAVHAALEWVLKTGAEHPVLSRMAEEARAGTTATLLPLLTMNGDRVLIPLRSMLAAAFLERWDLDERQVELNLDLVIRTVISYLVLPSDLSRAEVVDHLVRIATATLDGVARRADTASAG